MPRERPSSSPWLRAACVPLFFYLSVTLVVPALRGAYRRPAFWEHAAMVVACCAAILALFALVRWTARGLTRDRRRALRRSGRGSG